MRLLAFASRNGKELVRDPLSILFGVALPVLLLLLIVMIQKSMPEMPVDIFKIEIFTPGIAMFSLSFISLFSGMLLANDRSSSFLARLFASPLKASDYLVGYSLPLIPIAILQSVICFVTALFLGLPSNANILLAIVSLLPVAVLFIGFGLLLGSILTEKQIGPIASVVVQVAALSSGMWFDLDMIGGLFKSICYALPFAHAVDLAQAALMGEYNSMLTPLYWVLAYSVVIFFIAIVLFKRKMKG